MDVNDQGHIAGTGFEFPNPGSLIECRRDSLFWAGSTAAPVRLVPDVAADEAFARAIRNQLGSGEIQVVGQNTTVLRALLWIRSGTTWTTYRLIDRLLQVNGWSSLRDATDINECGWIVGFGVHSGNRAYLLVPTVPSCFADLNGDCKVNGFDLALLLGDDGNPDCATRTCLGDLDWTNGPEEDDPAGDVDSYDLAILLGAWTGANLCSEDCVEGWGGCGSTGGESALGDGGTNPTLIAQLLVQLIELGYLEEAATLVELTSSDSP